jgi:hypothetical protein
MDVGELKRALENVPDSASVVILRDDVYQEKVNAWWASYDKEEKEDTEEQIKKDSTETNQANGEDGGEFILHC